MTSKKFLVIFLISITPMIAVLAYLIVYASTTSTPVSFGIVMTVCIWIIFSIEYAGRLQKRGRPEE